MILYCEIIQTAPDYIWQGLFRVLLIGVSTIVVAFVTSWIFKRKDEVTRVEGVLLEKKLEIYRLLSDKLFDFEELHQFNDAEVAHAKRQIEECGLEMPQFYHVPSFMNAGADKIYEKLMEFDRLATENKMYYDDYTAWPIFVLQNYNGLLIRFHAMFRDGITGEGFEMTDKVKKVEDDMFRAIGLVFCEEWGERVEKVLASLQDSVNNLSLKHRKKPKYDYHTMQDPNGPMMRELQESKLMKERDKITQLITSYVALGLIAAGMTEKDLRKMKSHLK
jgi:hypothetical protein